MGLLYTIYRKDVSRRFVKGIYKGNVCITWGTNKDHIGSRPKVRGSILGSLYSKARNPNGDFNNILPTNRQINGTTKPDTRIVPMTLRQLRTEQLGIIIINYTVCI